MPWETETRIPYGNACGISVQLEGDAPVIRFSADPKGGPESLWFCLRMRNTSPGEAEKPLGIVLENVDNMLGAKDLSKVRPVVRRKGGGWQRMPSPREVTREDGRRECGWVIDRPGQVLDLALCYPYGVPEVECLVRESQGSWRVDTIGSSQGGRPLLRLSNLHLVGKDVPGVFLISRQHSGETPGSWVLDGLLRTLAVEKGDVLVWAVPLANIDGVEEGFYGKDNFPYDLNRAWGDPPMRHETLVCRRDMSRFFKRCRPILGLDLHAPGCCESSGIYAFLPQPDRFPEQHERASGIAELVGRALGKEYAAEPFGRVASYSSRWNTPGFAQRCCMEGFPALSLETPYSYVGDTVLTEESYREAGRRIALCVLDLVDSGGVERV